MYLQNTKKTKVQKDLSFRKRYILRITKGDFKAPSAITRNVILGDEEKEKQPNSYFISMYLLSSKIRGIKKRGQQTLGEGN